MITQYLSKYQYVFQKKIIFISSLPREFNPTLLYVSAPLQLLVESI